MISINIYEIVMQMANFLILMLLIKKFLVKPMGGLLKKRAEDIDSILKKTEKDQSEAEALLAQQKEILKQARIEAQNIRQKTEAASKKEKEVIIQEAKKESEQLMKHTKKELELDLSKAKKELVADIADLSISLSEKVLKRRLSEQDKQEVLSHRLDLIKDQ